MLCITVNVFGISKNVGMHYVHVYLATKKKKNS